jgi:hypothetical protein
MKMEYDHSSGLYLPTHLVHENPDANSGDHPTRPQTAPRRRRFLPEWLIRFLEWLAEILQGIGAFGAFVVAIALYFQGDAMRQIATSQKAISQDATTAAAKSADAQEETNQLTKILERAYIVYSDITVADLQANKAPTFFIEFDNTGRSIASNPKLNVTIRTLSTKELPNEVAFDKTGDYTPGSVSPGRAINIAHQSSKPLSPTEYSAIQRGDMKLFVYGWIEYSDGFKTYPRSEYCTFFVPNLVGISKTPFGKCTNHNS